MRVIARMRGQENSILGKLVHGLKLFGANSIGVRAIFVVVDQVISNLVGGFPFICFHLSRPLRNLGPDGCLLDIDAGTNLLIGLEKRPLRNGVLVPIVIDEPVSPFAYLFTAPFIVNKSFGV